MFVGKECVTSFLNFPSIVVRCHLLMQRIEHPPEFMANLAKFSISNSTMGRVVSIPADTEEEFVMGEKQYLTIEWEHNFYVTYFDTNRTTVFVTTKSNDFPASSSS